MSKPPETLEIAGFTIDKSTVAIAGSAFIVSCFIIGIACLGCTSCNNIDENEYTAKATYAAGCFFISWSSVSIGLMVLCPIFCNKDADSAGFILAFILMSNGLIGVAIFIVFFYLMTGLGYLTALLAISFMDFMRTLLNNGSFCMDVETIESLVHGIKWTTKLAIFLSLCDFFSDVLFIWQVGMDISSGTTSSSFSYLQSLSIFFVILPKASTVLVGFRLNSKYRYLKEGPLALCVNYMRHNVSEAILFLGYKYAFVYQFLNIEHVSKTPPTEVNIFYFVRNLKGIGIEWWVKEGTESEKCFKVFFGFLIVIHLFTNAIILWFSLAIYTLFTILFIIVFTIENIIVHFAAVSSAELFFTLYGTVETDKYPLLPQYLELAFESIPQFCVQVAYAVYSKQRSVIQIFSFVLSGLSVSVALSVKYVYPRNEYISTAAEAVAAVIEAAAV